MKNKDILNLLNPKDMATILKILVKENENTATRVEQIIEEMKFIQEINISLDKPVDLLVIAPMKTAIKCKIVNTGDFITFRRAGFDEAPGEILTVMPSKVWKFRYTHYISGKVQSKRIDIPALQLKPLALKDAYLWNPENEFFDAYGKPIDLYLKPIIEFGPRHSYEMETVPHKKIEDFSPILDAEEHYDEGDNEGALKIIGNVLMSELRCLDAHAILGAWKFNGSKEHHKMFIELEKKHYEVGIDIAEFSLPKDFNGLLPWERFGNQPFLRCLQGYGVCLWRLGDLDAARKVFERILWLSPLDGQDIRFF